MKTIRQIADEIGVSKQAVFKKIKREPLSTSLQGLTATVDGRLMVEVDGEKLIKQAFSEIAPSTTDNQLTGTVDGLVDDIIQALRPMIKGRHRRHYHRPELRGLNQQSQMAEMERGLPHTEHQRTTLLQHDIGRPRQ